MPYQKINLLHRFARLRDPYIAVFEKSKEKVEDWR